MNTGQIVKSKSGKRFTHINNSVLKNDQLSMQAKGLYAYLQSLPEDWIIYKNELQRNFNNGRDSVNSAFKELQDFGLILTVEIRGDRGKIGYNHIVYDDFQVSPHTEKPLTDEPHTVRPSTVNPPLQNTERQITDYTKKDNTETPAALVLAALFVVKLKSVPNANPFKVTIGRERMIKARAEEFKKHWPGRDFLKACKFMFEYKAKEWYGTNMWKYFMPDTLLNSENFVKYLEKAEENKGVPEPVKANNQPPPTTAPPSVISNPGRFKKYERDEPK